MNYRIGHSDGLAFDVRHEILSEIISGQIPPYDPVSPEVAPTIVSASLFSYRK
jgi:hypothetical protein